MRSVLAAPAPSRQHAGRCDVAGPCQQWNKDQPTGCEDCEEAGDHGARESGHQPHEPELDAVELFGIEAGLDQIQGVNTRGPHVQPSPPNQRNWTEPALIPAFSLTLMQTPLEWRQRAGSNKRGSGWVQGSRNTEQGLEPGETCERCEQRTKCHASNRAIRRLSAIPAISRAAASGKRTKRPNAVSSSTLNNWGLIKRR